MNHSLSAYSPETKPFWDAAINGRFLLPRCQRCEKTHWYPRGICPYCMSTSVSWEESTGVGEIFSFSVNRTGKDHYVLAYVALSEGPIILSNVIGADPYDLSIGTKVKVFFSPAPGGQSPVPLFRVC